MVSGSNGELRDSVNANGPWDGQVLSGRLMFTVMIEGQCGVKVLLGRSRFSMRGER